MRGAFAEGRTVKVGGTIKRRGVTYDIVPLILDGTHTAWVGEAGVMRIESN